MDAGSRRESAARPPEHRSGSDPSADTLEAADVAATFDAIAADAVVAFDIGVDARGDFVDARTGVPNRPVVDLYSRMKHGDLAAVTFFARHLSAAAIGSARFLSLNQKAIANERVIYLTTTAVFNSPSASNLLLRATAAQLNILLSRRELAPLVVVEQTRLSENSLGYPSSTVRSRRGESAPGRGVTLVPEQFRDQSVVFLDDLFNTGYTIKRAEVRLRRIEAADRFFLFAARMDPRAVAGSAGTVEDRLNATVITGTLASTAPMLQRGNFVVVQKLLKVILDPRSCDQLAEFLQDIPTSSILELYAAAARDGFRHRNHRTHLPSLLVLERVLEERGALDPDGHFLPA